MTGISSRLVLHRRFSSVCAVLSALLAQGVAAQDVPTVVLPSHLPAACFEQAAQDYQVPPLVLVALVKHESRGRNGAVGNNRDGSQDIGVAQHNTSSWVPYLRERYGIEPEDLRTNPCQSIRAAAYVLRKEQNRKACSGKDIWCGVGHYHAPGNEAARAAYVPKVRAALQDLLQRGHF